MGIEDIHGYVADECRRGTNDEHLAVVARYANCLAPRLGANAQVVQLAAYLHDISAVRDIATLRDHAAVSAAQAHDLLSAGGYLPVERGRHIPDCPPGLLVVLCLRCPEVRV